MDNIMENIKKCIGTKHGAKKELAKALGVDPNVITSWYSGRTKSYMSYLPQIADHFGVSIDWLSGNSEETKKPAPPEGYELSDLDFQLLKKLPKMTVQEKLMLLAQIETQQKLKEDSF